ncbi:MAG: repressor LexA [Firmicutes bacterium]|nr:repressor LexA [Bacillota bacterium]
MRSKNPELMEQISRYIGEYFRDHHHAPTTREIGATVGRSAACIYQYLVEMDRKGILTYKDGKVMDLPKINKTTLGYFSAPLVGSIRCGDPENQEEEVELYVSLPEVIFGQGEFYLLRATGDSMEDAGIADGDLILIRKQTECKPGDIIVALDENGENTLKRYAGSDEKSGKNVLEYANEKVYPGKRILVDRLSLQGVAKSVIKGLG